MHWLTGLMIAALIGATVGPMSAQVPPKIVWGQSGTLETVETIAISPDGEYVACSGAGMHTYLFRLSDGILTKTLRLSAQKLAFSADGQLLATTSYRDPVEVWRTEDGGRARLLESANLGSRSLAFSPDGSLLAAAGLEGVLVWRLSDGKIAMRVEGRSYGTVAFSPDGRRLAVGGWGPEKLSILSVPDGNTLAVFETGGASLIDLSFSPDGRFLAASIGRSPYGVAVFNVDSGHMAIVDGNYVARWVAFSPDGKLLAASADRGGARLYSVEDWHCIATLPAVGTQWYNGLAFTPDSRNLITSGADWCLHVWDTERFDLARTIGGRVSRFFIRAVEVAPTRGLLFVLTSSGKNVTVFSLQDGAMLGTVASQKSQVYWIRVSPDERFLATCSEDGLVRLWSLENWNEVRRFEEATDGKAYRIDFCPAGKLIAASYIGREDSVVTVWRVDDGEPVARLRDLFYGTFGVRFSPEGRYLVGCFEEAVAVWSTEDWKIARWLPSPPGFPSLIEFSPDGRLLAVSASENAPATRSTVFVWDTASWDLQHRLQTERLRHRTLSFLEGGRLLARSYFYQDGVFLYDMDTGRLSRVLHEDCLAVSALASLPDGQGFVFGREDGSVHHASLGKTVPLLGRLRLEGWIGSQEALESRPLWLAVNGWSPIQWPEKEVMPPDTIQFVAHVPSAGTHQVSAIQSGFLGVAENLTTYGQPVELVFSGPYGNGAVGGDVNVDLRVDLSDLGLILADWGRAGRASTFTDWNGDQVVNQVDLVGALASFGLRDPGW